jgi:pyridoxamine 5'-phosphate oxidase
MDIVDVRREYVKEALRRDNLLSDPFTQFELWFKQACSAQMRDPNAMSLATASAEGRPTLRTVLLKYFDAQGFVFFTNYQSTKARQITENPYVSLLFLWLELDRQVTITGRAEKIPAQESLRYFLKRPRGSQLGAWVSNQSSVISSRTLLEMKFEEVKRKFAQGKIPLPSFWGGYRVRPSEFEFWQGRPNRLHDRFVYRQTEIGEWLIQRLAP